MVRCYRWKLSLNPSRSCGQCISICTKDLPDRGLYIFCLLCASQHLAALMRSFWAVQQIWIFFEPHCINYPSPIPNSWIMKNGEVSYGGSPVVPKSQWLSILNSSIFRWEWVLMGPMGPMTWIHFFVLHFVASRQDGCFLQQRHGSLVSWSGHRGHLPWSDLHSRAPALRTYELSQWRNNRCRWSMVIYSHYS